MVKRKPTKYQNIVRETGSKLDAEVNSQLLKGWELKGSCFITSVQDGCATHKTFVQTMVRYD
jgi:hypothetical protein